MEQALTAAAMPPRPHGECEVMHCLLSYSQLVQLLRVGAWTVKPLKDTFASRHVHSKYLIILCFLYLWRIQCSAVGREQLHLERLMNPHSSGSCSLLCIPGVRCCCHIPVVLREVLPHWQGGSLAISRDVEGDQCHACFVSSTIAHVSILTNLFK